VQKSVFCVFVHEKVDRLTRFIESPRPKWLPAHLFTSRNI